MGVEIAGIILMSLAIVILFFVLRRKPAETKSGAREPIDNDARRFARMLVTEIKLYNEYKVQRGLKNNNLYDSLQLEIEAARNLYQKRITGSDFQGHFDEALMEILADGDKSKLGLNVNS